MRILLKDYLWNTYVMTKEKAVQLKQVLTNQMKVLEVETIPIQQVPIAIQIGQHKENIPLCNSPSEAVFLLRVDQVIQINLHDTNFGTTQLHQALGIGRTKLHYKLKKLTNYSTSKYIRLLRLRKAQALLKTQNYTVAEVAYLVGFKSAAHFSRVYKKTFGTHPSETIKKGS